MLASNEPYKRKKKQQQQQQQQQQQPRARNTILKALACWNNGDGDGDGDADDDDDDAADADADADDDVVVVVVVVVRPNNLRGVLGSDSLLALTSSCVRDGGANSANSDLCAVTMASSCWRCGRTRRSHPV